MVKYMYMYVYIQTALEPSAHMCKMALCDHLFKQRIPLKYMHTCTNRRVATLPCKYAQRIVDFTILSPATPTTYSHTVCLAKGCTILLL